jgi:hypothetical protein
MGCGIVLGVPPGGAAEPPAVGVAYNRCGTTIGEGVAASGASSCRFVTVAAF